MKKQNLLGKAELRKVLGGAMAKDLCSTSSCYFEYLSVGYYGECGSSISDEGPLACTCSALGPFGEVIQSDPMPVCYVA